MLYKYLNNILDFASWPMKRKIFVKCPFKKTPPILGLEEEITMLLWPAYSFLWGLGAWGQKLLSSENISSVDECRKGIWGKCLVLFSQLFFLFLIVVLSFSCQSSTLLFSISSMCLSSRQKYYISCRYKYSF